jgi:hypothetical protein
VSYFTLHCGKLVPCSKCHGNRISEIARLRRKWGVFYRPIRHGDLRDTQTQPSRGLAAGAFSLLAVVGGERCVELRRFSAAVATSREGHRSLKLGRECQHRRWGRERCLVRLGFRQTSRRAPIAVKTLTPNVWRRCRPRLDVFHALRENLSSALIGTKSGPTPPRAR